MNLTLFFLPAGSEAAERKLHAGQREADGGELHQGQSNGRGVTARQVKDSLTLFQLILIIIFISVLPTRSLRVLAPATAELVPHQSCSSPLSLPQPKQPDRCARHRPPVDRANAAIHTFFFQSGVKCRSAQTVLNSGRSCHSGKTDTVAADPWAAATNHRYNSKEKKCTCLLWNVKAESTSAVH